MAVRSPSKPADTPNSHHTQASLTARMPWQEARDYVGEKATAAKETLTGKAHETGQAASDTASSAKEYGALSHCDGWSFVLPLTPQPSYVNSAREGSAGRSKD